MKKILVLGGTLFVGRVLVEELLEEGRHSVTLFNRGLTRSDLFPAARRIIGDRYVAADFAKPCREDWDCVIDTSGYFPDALERELQMLKGRVRRHIFISSVSACDFENLDGVLDEETTRLPCSTEEKTDKATVRFGNLLKPDYHLYGPKKAECERILLANDWLDSVILRPAIIYGRYDFCDRFYYWLYRMKTQDRVLVPEDGGEKQNNTFVNDLVSVMTQAIEIARHAQVYNVVTHEPISLRSVLATMANVFGTSPRLLDAPRALLESKGIRPNFEIPCLWDGFDVVTSQEKLRRDFETPFHSFVESIRKTAAYHDQVGWREGKDGMTVAMEAEILSLLDAS